MDTDLKAENEELRRLLEDAESTLSAIRNGEVDALIIGGKEIYTLQGADHPYRVLVEAMQQGAVTLSPGGAIVYCNSGFAQMVNRSADKLIGVNIETIFSSSDHKILKRRLAETETIAEQTEMIINSDDGSRLPVLVSFSRLPLDGFSAVCLVITDLTEHKKNQQLQDTDRRKDEFLAMLAHELRNPLAPIANAMHMLCLANRTRDEAVQWACDVVGRQVQQMTRIVDDLLDVSRITRGKVNLQMIPIDVSSIVAAAVETSRPLIESRRHQLKITLASEPLKVNADLTRMAQVLTNLLNNAAKYTDDGGEIFLSFERDGSEAKISVRDNGTGIPADILPTVFDLFTQADRTADRSQGGLGIGLTLVRSLVEMHGGSVFATSDGPGRGSEFSLRLPLITENQPNQNSISFLRVNGKIAAHRHRILVVDDNVDSATSLAKMLEMMGNDTRVAHDGVGAIQSAETYKPDLVLLDIGLPGMNGYAVAEQMRARPLLKKVVIAALTGYGDERDRQRTNAAGFDHHFVKPLSINSLESLLGTLSTISDGI